MKIKLFIIVFVVALTSCQQLDLEFSCDPVINNYVKEHQLELSVLMLDDFLNYDYSMQKAIYQSWDPWKKRDIWIEKLERIAKWETLTTEEIEYIQQVIEHIDSDYFLSENLERREEIHIQFATQWINGVKNNLGWTDHFIAFLVYRLYTEENQLKDELSELASITKEVGTDSEGNCNCAQSADFCGLGICISYECDVISGCGWLWSMDCNGICNF